MSQCLDCEALLAEMRSDDAAFKTTMPFERFAADFDKRRHGQSTFGQVLQWWKRIRWPVTAVAAASAAALMLVLVQPKQPSTTTKGGQSHLGFLVKEDDGVRRGADGERLLAGDRIQFLVLPKPDSRTMVLVGIDGQGAVTVYSAETISGQPKGDDSLKPLPESIILDEAVGPERFFVVFSTQGDAESLHQRVQSAALELANSGDSLVDEVQLDLGSDDMWQDSISIIKVEK